MTGAGPVITWVREGRKCSA